MIFVTVGMQLPFARLVDCVDRLAPRLACRIVAQIGATGRPPKGIEYHRKLGAAEFSKLVADADVIVGHAGVGTILSARRARKPLIIFPRRASLGEHRSDHQIATAHEMCGRSGVHTAFNEEELESLLLSRATLALPDGEANDLAALKMSIQGSLAQVLGVRAIPAPLPYLKA